MCKHVGLIHPCGEDESVLLVRHGSHGGVVRFDGLSESQVGGGVLHVGVVKLQQADHPILEPSHQQPSALADLRTKMVAAEVSAVSYVWEGLQHILTETEAQRRTVPP